MRRGADGAVSGDGGAGRWGPVRPDCGAEAVPLLVRRGVEPGRGGRAAGRPGPVRPGAGLAGGVRRPGVQDQPGQPGGTAHLAEGDGWDAEGAGHGEGPGLGGEGRPAPAVLRGEIHPGGGGHGGDGVRRHGPDPHPGGPGPGGRGGLGRAGAGAGAGLSGPAPGGGQCPHPAGPAPGAGGGGPPAPGGVERGAGGDPGAPHGGGAAGGAVPAVGAAVRGVGGLRPRADRLPGDHRRPGGGCGALRAPAPLRRGAPPAGAAGAGGGAGAGHRLRPERAGRPLAAAHPHPPDGEGAQGGAHGRARHRSADHPPDRAGPPEAHRGGRLPAGHLPGGAPGADEREKRAAGAVVQLPAGGAHGECGPGHDGFAADGGGVPDAGAAGGSVRAHGERPRVRGGGLLEVGGGLHRGPGAVFLRGGGLPPLPQRGGGHRRGGLRPGAGCGQSPRLGVLRPRGGIQRALGRGAGPYAPGQRVASGGGAAPAGAVRPGLPDCHELRVPGGVGQGAGGHFPAGLRPGEAPCLPARPQGVRQPEAQALEGAESPGRG